MHILIVSKYGQTARKEVSVIPRVGDRVCLFYKPWPTVKEILFWPDETLKYQFSITEPTDAMITVE